MPLSWNTIRDNALAFSKRWEDAVDENAEAKPFWEEFFRVFGVDRKRVATFEYKVHKLGSRQGYIDLLWKGVILIEHKSRGKNLDRAYNQAREYFPGLRDWELPHYILTCDFQKFCLYDLETDEHFELSLDKLHEHVKLFGFLVGTTSRPVSPQDPVNLGAAERMGKLHDLLKTAGCTGHPLEVLLTRLLFCLFAEDTGLFPRRAFMDFLETRCREDGVDLGAQLNLLFQVLNTSTEQRPRSIDEELAAFPYIDGSIFAETLPPAFFDRTMREKLLDAAVLDWGRISPAIFGALFQSVLDPAARRNLGAHYTSEENIKKVIGPLFLDDLWEEFETCGGNVRKLAALHKKLETLIFLDPACGCGNFLVVAYRELRLLELQILRELRRNDPRKLLDISFLVRLNVTQFFGIELEEFPARIAETALWLTDHQMNLIVSEEFGQYFARLPLTAAPHIIQGNALRIDWPKADFIFGNPPFVGSKFMSPAQREDLLAVCDFPSAGILDYVTAWYVKAAKHCLRGADSSGVLGSRFVEESEQEVSSPSRVAFVSTNSITQGEQVGVLWKTMMEHYGACLHFAHRTFRWNNEARHKAAVFCVIIGFGFTRHSKPMIFEYDTPDSEPRKTVVKRINDYMVDAPDVFLPSRSKPLCSVPEIGIGNKPIDGGHYLFTPEEKEEFLLREPSAAPWFRRWIGAVEFLNGYERWCLWLGECPPNELRRMPEALKRVELVRQCRLASKSAPTRKLAETPTRFHVENIPTSRFLLIPKVSSERRFYIPLGFILPDTLCSDLIHICKDAKLYHFGILSSFMHMAWVRTVCGRMKSDYRYSSGIVYNNFPWPPEVDEKQRQAVEDAALSVLDTRTAHPGCTLADLYDPLTMPTDLMRAHQTLDRAVDRAYGKNVFPSESARVAFLFDLYRRLSGRSN